ncbi:FAD-dependent oxidoreductase [Kerstersia gyiorum]|uniref:FAD-binding domain-containing protein n=2 Tax=Kerstersia gyiorum TaxID=206506 RepID=A0A171KNV0_9BURK|nr:NAD(P)/FAD-dependent oxidoreductase [Kerstersia gyiorum]KKO70567.1 hypothetical protein AAV32_16115 [Kerstersia gyiorum]
MQQHPNVVIVGAGPAGLTAANILSQHGWPITVIEADATPTSRDQGGSLDLHPDDGQLALAKAGLLQEFLSLARHEDQESRDVDAVSGKVMQVEIPEPGTGNRPEIDRVVLRQLLLQRLDTGAILWDSPVQGISDRPDGRYDIHFSHCTRGPFDIVIGADGAWSRVRTALSDVRPSYTGVTFMELWLHDVDRRHPALADLVGHGTLFSLHGEAGIFAQRNGEATIRVYAVFKTTTEETERTDQTLAGISTADIVKRFDGWAPSLLTLITDADRIVAPRPINALPADFRWPHRRGLTLIGDAAHVMPPLGEGVNTAMLDAAKLAEALVSTPHWDEAISACEESMRQRVAPIAARCIDEFAQWFSISG